MATTGTATLDFGAFPGKSDASIAVTGQASILSGSFVEAWIAPAATADHSADEHMLETLRVFAGNIVAATGFTIYGFNTSQLNENPADLGARHEKSGEIGRGTLLYGTWNIAWVWS